MIEEVGKDEVEENLDEFDEEVKRLRALVIDAVLQSSEFRVRMSQNTTNRMSQNTTNRPG